MKKGKLFFFSVVLFTGIFSVNVNGLAQSDTIPDSTIGNREPTLHYETPAATFVQRLVMHTSYPGVIWQIPDSVMMSHNEAGSLAELFSANGVFLKSYGNGQLSTTSFRGASASQTNVLWNGVDLRSSTNGIADLSIMPAILFDEAALTTGSVFNSIGGAINLNSLSHFHYGAPEFKVKIASQLGEFGKTDNGIKLSYGRERFACDVRAYYQHADNDFRYFPVNGGGGSAPDTLSNAAFYSKGLSTDLRWRLKKENDNFQLHSWYSDSYREIPPTMLEVSSEANQTDRFFRNVLSYDHWSEKVQVSVATALLTEYMLFVPGNNQVNSETNSISFQNIAGIRFHPKGYYIIIRGEQKWTQANVTQYLPQRTQERYGIGMSVSHEFKEKLNMIFLLHDEFLGSELEPLTGSIGAEYYCKKYFTLRLSAGRKYRLPTFNDLYWNPGGNPDLKPEDSRNLDGGIEFNMQKDHFHFHYALNGYYRYTYNWIQWQPGPGYWVPQNLYEVQSYGSENRLKTEWKKNDWQLFVIAGLDYVRATNEKAIIAGDSSIGKQLMYLPAYTSNILFHAAWSGFYFEFQVENTGLRFTATDHSSWLPAYSLYNITAGKRIDIKGEYTDIFIRCNNLTDVNYQAVAWRAMPGRNFECGLTINFKSETKPTTIQ
ncbi:MAG TPA: TonB-dependent receptor [Bacteroidia bacterium]|jgi:iron complex outermembrane receptor protein|nr:TonB-dependent receptor [Bacteroidia bacterium]